MLAVVGGGLMGDDKGSVAGVERGFVVEFGVVADVKQVRWALNSGELKRSPEYLYGGFGKTVGGVWGDDEIEVVD